MDGQGDGHTTTMDLGETTNAGGAPMRQGGAPAAIPPEPAPGAAPDTRAVGGEGPLTRDRPAKGMPKKITIILENSDDIPPTGQPVSVNGYAYLIRPGVRVEVPEAVVNVLSDAIVKKPIIDPTNRKIVGWREQLRFPFRIVG